MGIKSIMVAQRLKEGYVSAIKYDGRIFMTTEHDIIHGDIVRRLVRTEYKDRFDGDGEKAFRDICDKCIYGFITLKDGIFLTRDEAENMFKVNGETFAMRKAGLALEFGQY